MGANGWLVVLDNKECPFIVSAGGDEIGCMLSTEIVDSRHVVGDCDEGECLKSVKMKGLELQPDAYEEIMEILRSINKEVSEKKDGEEEC